MSARLKTGLWVHAVLRQSNIVGRFGAVLRKGDEDAGGVLVVLRGANGLVLLSQMRTGDGDLAWMRASGPAPVEQAQIDALVDKQTRFDPDLWVVEFDSPDLRPPFEAQIV